MLPLGPRLSDLLSRVKQKRHKLFQFVTFFCFLLTWLTVYGWICCRAAVAFS
jgi:hypothetical protein